MRKPLRGLLLAILGCLGAADLGARAMTAPPDTVFAAYRDTFCASQTLLIGNQFFDPTRPSGQVLFPGAAAGGMDSVLLVQLTFLQPAEATIAQTLCEGDTLWVNGTPYHAGFYLGEEVVDKGAANGCDSIIQVELTFLPAPFVVLRDTLCPGEFRMVNGRRYDAVNSDGWEILAGEAASGCDSIVEVHLFFPEIWLYAGPDQAVGAGDTVRIGAELGFDPVRLHWLPPPPCPQPDCLEFTFQAAQSGQYILEAEDASGCVLRDTVRILVSEQNPVYAPTVFAPSAAPPNDRFFLGAGQGVGRVRLLRVANRWGEVLFEGRGLLPDDASTGWDGRWKGGDAPTGVYLYFAELERLDGSVFRHSGSFTLLR